jgi:hypothetical protein
MDALFIPNAQQIPQPNIVSDDELYIPLKHPIASYSGSYYSEEAQATLEIKEKDGKLWMVRPGGRIAAFPVVGDETAHAPAQLFSGDQHAHMKFTWEKDSVTGFTISVSRASNVVFVKNNPILQK